MFCKVWINVPKIGVFPLHVVPQTVTIDKTVKHHPPSAPPDFPGLG